MTHESRGSACTAFGLGRLSPDFRNQCDCVFWTKCYRRESFENLSLQCQPPRPIKVDRPSQSLHKYDSRSWGAYLQNIEVTLDTRVRTQGEGNDLDGHVRPIRRLDEAS